MKSAKCGIGVLLMCAVAPVMAAGTGSPSEVPMLPQSEYRLPLEQVIVIGQRPYWKQPAAPRFEEPKLDLKEPASAQSRMQFLPRYVHDERDDYRQVRDQSKNPEPRIKLFEFRF